QRLVNAVMPPPQGLLSPVIGSPSLLVFRSILSKLSFSGFGSSGASVKIIHGGATVNSASGFKLAMAICTPGTLIPSLGSAGGAALASFFGFSLDFGF